MFFKLIVVLPHLPNPPITSPNKTQTALFNWKYCTLNLLPFTPHSLITTKSLLNRSHIQRYVVMALPLSASFVAAAEDAAHFTFIPPLRFNFYIRCLHLHSLRSGVENGMRGQTASVFIIANKNSVYTCLLCKAYCGGRN